MKLKEDALNQEIENIKNQASEVEFSMAKMNEYLITEEEIEMDANIAKSIIFPETKTGELDAASVLNDNNFLEELKNQASEKTREEVELYALEKRVKEYLTVETEKPLELEEWMTNNKCWCPELFEEMALAEEK